jgi:hypothetical protein
MEAIHYSETSVLRAIRHNIPVDGILHSCRHEVMFIYLYRFHVTVIFHGDSAVISSLRVYVLLLAATLTIVLYVLV